MTYAHAEVHLGDIIKLIDEKQEIVDFFSFIKLTNFSYKLGYVDSEDFGKLYYVGLCASCYYLDFLIGLDGEFYEYINHASPYRKKKICVDKLMNKLENIRNCYIDGECVCGIRYDE